MRKTLFIFLLLISAYGGYRIGGIASGATLSNAEKEASKLIPPDFTESRDVGSYSGIITGNHAYAAGKKPGRWSRNNPDPAKILSEKGWRITRIEHHGSGDTAYAEKRGLDSYLTFRDGTVSREGKGLIEASSSVTPTSLGLIWAVIGLFIGIIAPIVTLKLWRRTQK